MVKAKSLGIFSTEGKNVFVKISYIGSVFIIMPTVDTDSQDIL